MPCTICGETLLIGKGLDDTVLWCPKCSGIEVHGKSELIKLSAQNLKSKSDDKKKILLKYNKKSIIGSLCATLEAFSVEGTNFRNVCSVSYAIKDILKKKDDEFGSQRLPYMELQQLLHIYEFEFQELHVNHSLINDGYVVAVVIPADKISEYSMNQYHLQMETEETVLRFTEDWNYNRLIATRYGLYSQNDLSKEHGPKHWSIKYLNNNELNRVKYLFQFTAGTSKLSKDLKSNVDLIDALKQLSDDLFYLYIPDFLEGRSGTIHASNRTEIIESLSKAAPDPDLVYNKIVSTEFPLIVEVEDLCFALPNTCNFYLRLLYAQKYDSKLNLEKNIWGTRLEELVFKVVDAYGYQTTNPFDQIELLNFLIEDKNDIINGKTRTYELDVAGFKDDCSVIIECKHWDIGADFFRRRSVEKRKKDLIRELDKFQRKIDLIKSDDKFSFLSKDKTLKAFMVTLHPEPIEEYGDIKVVPYNQFKPGEPDFDSYEKTDLNIRPDYIFTQRIYKTGALEGIDYTRMVLNPFGINHFSIEPENELNSYIYVGDGIVKNFDHDELTIDTPCSMRVIVDLIEEDFGYLKSRKIKKNSKVRYQIYTTDPLLSSYYLRFIRKM